ncbi:hypothetical protein SS37A_36970 (plasmid) [Methylocystis iwaonis]|uniref:DDE domain-containing protein n=1 Tax=Methylocystis iwaonis TaxID=2885079 RepID=A0ABN6VPX1_9HYPH|nr:hypothetical protein SS37A_36970 [Methylocystis iwaonis]
MHEDGGGEQSAASKVHCVQSPKAVTAAVLREVYRRSNPEALAVISSVILWGVRWYVAYPVSYRQLEEMMEGRGVEADHSTLNRWVVKYAPELERRFRSRKRPVGDSWRLDETYVKIKGSWRYLYRAVDKAGAAVTSC